MVRTPNTQKYSAVAWEMHCPTDGMSFPIVSHGFALVGQGEKTGPARCMQTLSGHSNWVRALAFAPDGSRLASASWDGTVKLWEVGEVNITGIRGLSDAQKASLRALGAFEDTRVGG